MNPSDPLPQDMRDLLIRLDQRVQDGFESVGKKLEQMDVRFNNLEQRVVTLERDTANRPFLIGQHQTMLNEVAELNKWRTSSEGQIKGAAKMGGWMKAGVGVILAMVAYLGYQVEVAPQPQAHHPTTEHREIGARQ